MIFPGNGLPQKWTSPQGVWTSWSFTSLRRHTALAPPSPMVEAVKEGKESPSLDGKCKVLEELVRPKISLCHFFFNTICFLFSTLYTNYIQQGVNSGLFSIWRWVWASPRSCWWTGRPGVLQSKGSQRVRHDWVTELILFMGIMIQFHFFVFFITHVKYLFRDNEHVLPLLEKKEKMKMPSYIL